MWDVHQYRKFQPERSRPFHDLLARVPDLPFAAVADLGSGPGELTRVLADRWPRARVTGVDSSPEMLEAAKEFALPGRLEFIQADVVTWNPPAPLDLVVSNAALQLIPDHETLLPRLAGRVAPGGVLAVQMPANAAEPIHTALAETLREGTWREKCADTHLPSPLREARWYVETLGGLGFEVDAWTTVYHHLLPGRDPVLEWSRGSTMRPVLARLDGRERAEFEETYGARLRRAYPRIAGGTLFPFPRFFVVARRGRV
ncbi:MAG TPA: methyltransferase domain-containing protein [Planctomycetota bacterium]|jgi:trans-aconitate 2-methyltransferase|nr:methyltransferase domain-containing protein [Planctomycetota bacterium]